LQNGGWRKAKRGIPCWQVSLTVVRIFREIRGCVFHISCYYFIIKQKKQMPFFISTHAKIRKLHTYANIVVLDTFHANTPSQSWSLGGALFPDWWWQRHSEDTELGHLLPVRYTKIASAHSISHIICSYVYITRISGPYRGISLLSDRRPLRITFNKSSISNWFGNSHLLAIVISSFQKISSIQSKDTTIWSSSSENCYRKTHKKTLANLKVLRVIDYLTFW